MSEADELAPEFVAAWARLLRVGQALLSAADAELKSRGLPPLAWYDAMLELKRAGDRGLRPFELQREMLLAQYNISRLIDRLVGAGYVDRRSAATDGRGQVLTITEAGRARLKTMWPTYRSIIKSAFADRLDAQEAADLKSILVKLETAPRD